MNIDTTTAFSHDNAFQLSVTIATPTGNPRGIILFIPGIYQTKEQFQASYEYFTNEQFICASYDHRGTGKSVRFDAEIGYFGANGETGLIEDIHSVIDAIQKKYSGIPCFIVTTDYASLMAINFLKQYDDSIRALAMISPISLFSELKRQRLLLEYISIVTPTYFKSNFFNRLFYKKVRKEHVSQLPFLYTNKGLYHLCDVGYMIKHQGNYYLKRSQLPIFIASGKKDKIKEYAKETKSLLNEIGYRNIDFRNYLEGTHDLLQSEQKDQLLHDLLLFFTLSL